MELVYLNPDKECMPPSPLYAQSAGEVVVKTGSGKLPWHADGVEISGHGYDEGEEQVWNIQRTKEVDVYSSICDFYLLEAVIAQVANPIPGNPVYIPPFTHKVALEMYLQGVTPSVEDPLEKLSLVSMIKQAELSEFLAPIFRSYLYVAISGELRHHYGTNLLGGTRSEISVSFHRMVEKFGADKTIGWMAEMFRQTYGEDKSSIWKSSFGGEKWAEGCDVLRWFEAGNCNGNLFTEREFCDRVFTLQHNGGTYLSKCSWGNLGDTQLALDAHAKSKWWVLYQGASESVQRVFEKYWHVSNAKLIENGHPPTIFNKYGVHEGSNFICSAYGAKDGFVKIEDKLFCNVEGCDCPLPKADFDKAKFLWYALEDENESSFTTGSSDEIPKQFTPVKTMVAKYPGLCKISKKFFLSGTPVVYHGMGNGASVLSEWVSMYGNPPGAEDFDVDQVIDSESDDLVKSYPKLKAYQSMEPSGTFMTDTLELDVVTENLLNHKWCYSQWFLDHLKEMVEI